MLLPNSHQCTCNYRTLIDVGVQTGLTQNTPQSWHIHRPGRPFRKNRLEPVLSIVKPKQNDGDLDFGGGENTQGNRQRETVLLCITGNENLGISSRKHSIGNSQTPRIFKTSNFAEGNRIEKYAARTRVSTNFDSAERVGLSSSFCRITEGDWPGAKGSFSKLVELEKNGLMEQYGRHLTQRTEEASLELSGIIGLADLSEDSLGLQF